MQFSAKVASLPNDYKKSMTVTNPKPKGTGFINVVKSAAAAAFGIQSQANRERDFESGKPVHFIIASVVTTLLFLFAVSLFVKIMIATNS